MAPDVPVGAWCDAAWSAWVDLMLRIDSPARVDALSETWDELNAPLPAEDGPSMDDWGTSQTAQAGAANLMSMLGGGMPAGGGE